MTIAFYPAFETTLDTTTYRLDSQPVYLAALGGTVAVVLLISLVIAARRRPGAIVSPATLVLVTVPVAVIVAVGLLRDVPGFSLFGGGDSHAATAVFKTAMELDAVSAGLGFGAIVSVTLILALRTGGQLRLLRLALPCLLAAMASASAALHAESITKVGSMPFYGTTGGKLMHVGRERDVPVILMRPPRRHWLFGLEDGPQPVDDRTNESWRHVSQVHVRATSAGKIPFTAETGRGPVTVTTKLSTEAVEEIASPLLSLRVGDVFTYRARARSSNGALLYFITLSGSETVHDLTLAVVGTRIRDGLRAFVIVVQREGSAQEVEVVAVAGETRLYDAAKGTVGAPIVAFDGEASGPDPVPCSFSLLSAENALCRRGAGAAPMTFEHKTSGSAGSGFATALVAVMTIGLVILPGDASASSYTLVATQRGPEGAPEALPN